MLNLVRYYCDSLRLSAEVFLQEPLFRELMESCWDEIDREMRTVRFFHSYSRARQPHLASAQVSPLEESNMYRVRLDVQRTSERVSVPAGTHRPSQMLNCLSKLEESFEFSCFVQFTYPTQTHRATLGFPVKYSEPRALPFDIVRGYHVEKTENDAVIYEVIVDHPRDGNPFVVVIFTYEGRLSTDLPELVATEASRIAALFVQRI